MFHFSMASFSQFQFPFILTLNFFLDCCGNEVLCENTCETYRKNNGNFPKPIGPPGVSHIATCSYYADQKCRKCLTKICSQSGYRELCKQKFGPKTNSTGSSPGSPTNSNPSSKSQSINGNKNLYHRIILF